MQCSKKKIVYKNFNKEWGNFFFSLEILFFNSFSFSSLHFGIAMHNFLNAIKMLGRYFKEMKKSRKWVDEKSREDSNSREKVSYFYAIVFLIFSQSKSSSWISTRKWKIKRKANSICFLKESFYKVKRRKFHSFSVIVYSLFSSSFRDIFFMKIPSPVTYRQ
jgi:hypothetical protein